MTIIFSDHGDIDCQVLYEIFHNIPNAKIIRITEESCNCKSQVIKALDEESDTLLIMGHGTQNGLLSPSYGIDPYIINKDNVSHIHARRTICIWCYASEFIKMTNLKAFATYMFISNPQEASFFNIHDLTQEDINTINKVFYDTVKQAVMDNTPLTTLYDTLKENVDTNNPIDVFNRENLSILSD